MIDEVAQRPAHPWGFWATLVWLALVLALWLWGFDRLEHALLNGTAFGRMIGTNVVLAAVRIRRCRVRDYLGWLRPHARDVLLAVLLALAVQFVYYAFFYLAGEDITAAAVEQYRAETTAGTPHWVPMLLGWPAIICAPIVEETVFRGFVWRGWAQSPLGAAGTWLLTSLVFAAYHVPNAMEMHPALAGVMLVQVFLLGLSLGWVRWRSGTTSATIIGHVAHNLVPPLFAFLVGAMFVRTTMIG